MIPFINKVKAVGPAVGNVITKFQIWNTEIARNTRLLFEKLHLGALAPVKSSVEELDDKLAFLRGTSGALDDQLVDIAENLIAYEEENRSATEILEEHRKEQSRVEEALESLGSSFEETGEKSTKAFDDMVDAVRSVRQEIEDVYREMGEAEERYRKNLVSEEENYREKAVRVIAEAERDIVDLTNDRQIAIAQGKIKEVNDLNNKIREKESILRTYNQMGMDLETELAEYKEYLAMNELEKIAHNYEEKRVMLVEQHKQERWVRINKLIDLSKEHTKILSIIGKEKEAAVNAEIEKAKTFREKLAEKTEGLSNWMEKSKSMYRSFVASINATLSQIRTPTPGGIMGGYQFGTSYVPATGPYMLHKGEAVIPANRNTGRSSNITVNINGGNYLSEEVAEDMGNMIIDKLKLQLKL